MSKFRFYLAAIALIAATVIAVIKKLYLIAPLGVLAFILHILSNSCISKTLPEEESFKKCMIMMSIKSLVVIVFVIVLIVSLLKNP